MEFRGFKIDFMALAALVGAVSGLWMQIKSNNKKKEEVPDAQKQDIPSP